MVFGLGGGSVSTSKKKRLFLEDLKANSKEGPTTWRGA